MVKKMIKLLDKIEQLLEDRNKGKQIITRKDSIELEKQENPLIAPLKKLK